MYFARKCSVGFSLFRTAFAFISPRIRDSVCASRPLLARSAFLRALYKAKSGRSLSIAGSLSISPHCNDGAKVKVA